MTERQKLDTRGETVAAQCRNAGLKVGDTIIGREGGVEWWQESQLTLLWIGKTNCVFLEKSRSDSFPNWRDGGECSNWGLHCRDWYEVKPAVESPKQHMKGGLLVQSVEGKRK